MSAIFGIIYKAREPIPESTIRKMQETLLHRAVDGKAVYHKHDVMLGHHLLIAQRRQAYEKQPFELHNCIITCDSRIDNIEELSIKLGLDNSKDITDPLIILAAYRHWGEKCLTYLKGEFVFVIWNKTTKTLFGASDHIGFRTLYYYESEKMLAFSSEIKAIEVIKSTPVRINQRIFDEYFTGLYHRLTYDKDVNILPPASFFTVSEKRKLIKKRYWTLKNMYAFNFTSPAEWYEHISAVLTEKIKVLIDSDHPVGILLSGGLDSSLVAAIACSLLKKENKKLLAFSCVLPEAYKGKETDERFYIDRLKEQFDNLEVHYVSIPDESGPLNFNEELFNILETPPNVLHYVETSLFKKASQLKVRVLLTGYGGDMALSHNGYGVIYHFFARGKFKKCYSLLKQKSYNSLSSFMSLLKRELLSFNPIYKTLRYLLKKRDSELTLFDSNFSKKLRKYNEAQNVGYKKSFIRGINRAEISSVVIQLKKHAAFYDQELCVPMLDRDFCQLFVSIPGELLMSDRRKRNLIREVMKFTKIPHHIIERLDKVNFSPDHRSRIAKMQKAEILSKFTSNNLYRLKIIKYDSILEKIGSKQMEDNVDDFLDKHLYYLPEIAIITQFNNWIQNKL